MNTDGVAELLGHPVKQIQIWAREGRIPAHREPGVRRWWFFRDDLVEWLRSDETRVKPPE
jgi:excisionase family DNA binding protein